ncbi:TetR family transcriptional regulator [Microlunatus soli]
MSESVGVSHATLVRHFGSKEKLIAEIDPDDPDLLRTVRRQTTSPRQAQESSNGDRPPDAMKSSIACSRTGNGTLPRDST